MTSQEVNTAITTSFAGIYLKQLRYLQGRNDNSITVAENHELNGNGVITLAGSASLYLKEVPCQESVSGMDDLSVCPETLVPEGPCVPVESGESLEGPPCVPVESGVSYEGPPRVPVESGVSPEYPPRHQMRKRTHLITFPLKT